MKTEKSKQTSTNYLILLLLAMILEVVNLFFISKYEKIYTILMYIVIFLVLILAAFMFFKKSSFKELFTETEEEKAKKEERRRKREEDEKIVKETTSTPQSIGTNTNVNSQFGCYGNYIGTMGEAIRNGKIELAHGLVVNDGKIQISLNEMVRFGYKPPKGFKVTAKGTLMPTTFKWEGNAYVPKEPIPFGFKIVTKGPDAGEYVPVDIKLIEGL